MNSDLINKIRSAGLRVTKVKEKIFEIMSSYGKPISASELVSRLKVNKTTVYREMESLLNNNIVSEVIFSDNLKRYELKDLPHHHHIVCLSCKKVEDVALNENLEVEEKKIAKKSKFKITKHNLEFFGFCANCQ